MRYGPYFRDFVLEHFVEALSAAGMVVACRDNVRVFRDFARGCSLEEGELRFWGFLFLFEHGEVVVVMAMGVAIKEEGRSRGQGSLALGVERGVGWKFQR